MKNAYKRYPHCFLLLVAALLSSGAAYAEAPASPENFTLQVHLGQPQGSQVEWDAVPGAASYKVWFREFDFETETAGDWEVVAEPTGTSYYHETNIFNLIAYKVSAVNSDGESEASEAISQCMTAVGPRNIEGDAVESMGGSGAGAVDFVDVVGNAGVSLHVAIGSSYAYDANTLGELLGPLVTQSGIEYAIEQGPAGMTIDPRSGALHWEADEAGMFTVTISARENGTDNYAVKSWELQSLGTTSVHEEPAFTQTGVWPSPARDVVNLRFHSRYSATRLSIVSANGVQVFSALLHTQAGENTHTLNVHNLADGAYFLQLRNSQGVKTLPFSIVR